MLKATTSQAELLTFRAAPGKVAVTFELCSLEQIVTIELALVDLDGLMRRMEKDLGMSEADKTDPARYAGWRAALAATIEKGVFGDFGEGEWSGLAALGVWCALNHPEASLIHRERFDRLVAQQISPHVTICRGPAPQHRFATMIGDRYLDVRQGVGW
jgi:hypothetical protein